MKARVSTLFCAVSFFALAMPAQAQQADQANTNAAASKRAEPTDAEIIVTGSRVIRNGNNSPAPVTVVSTAELQTTSPTTVFEALQNLPAFGGARGTAGAPASSAGGGNNNQISALNLRGLGPARTLVLFDGHRVPPTEQDGLVDTNTIPQMLLQRVDIVTGGASAVYGSDAIGGVVNFITDRKFTGLKMEAQSGISQQADDPTYKVGTAFGTKLFGGRGHFEASIEQIRDYGILRRTDRPDQFGARYTIQGSGTAASPYYLAANAVNSTYSFGGKITGPSSNPLANYTFSSNGMLTPFTNGQILNSTIQIGGDGAYDTSSSIVSSTNLVQGFGRFDFDVSDTVHFYIAGSYTSDHNFNYFGNANIQNVTISSNNAFLPAQYQQQMLAAGLSSFVFSKKYLTPIATNDFYTKTYYINTGLEGSFGRFHWDASYTRSYTDFVTQGNFTFNNGRTYAALDAVKDPSSGNIVCRVTLTNPGLYPGCVPLNVFGPSSESQDALNYAKQVGRTESRLPTDDVSASINGKLFEGWAGPIVGALSAEYRHQGFSLSSNSVPVTEAPLDCTGLRYNCTSPSATSLGTPQYNGSTATRTPVSLAVKEIAAELDIPLLRDFTLAKALNLNLAYRYADYTGKGSVSISSPQVTSKFTAPTWKIGLDWHVNDWLSLRGTRSRDIRAPNLYELYQPTSIGFTNSYTDLLTGRNVTPTNALVQTVSGGNVNLKPESADTVTLGIVLKPSRKFSLAIDGFDIRVHNFITRLNGYDPSVQQGCYAGNAFFCSLQVRPGPITNTSASNSVTAWYSIPVNVAALKTRGVDVEANFNTTIFNRDFSLRGLLTYQPHIRFYVPGATTLDYAGAYGTPLTSGAAGAKTRVTIFAHYSPLKGFAIDWQTRWRDAMHLSPDPTIVAAANTRVPAVSYSNVTFSQSMEGPFRGKATIMFNIENVFNQSAPVAASYANSGQPGLYGGFVPGDDPIGRYFNLSVKLGF